MNSALAYLYSVLRIAVKVFNWASFIAAINRSLPLEQINVMRSTKDRLKLY
jgi:hypothetical protein